MNKLGTGNLSTVELFCAAAEARSFTAAAAKLGTTPSAVSKAVQRLEKEKAPEVNAGGRSLSIQSWQSENRKFSVGDGDKTVARLRTFFYPYWQMRTADGNILPTHPDQDGVLLTEIPAGKQTIEMSFVRPRHQTIANIVSLLAVFAITGIALLAIRSNNPATVSRLILDS